LVTIPFLPNKRIIDSVKENGGDITGMVARVVTSFLPFILVRATAKAYTKPMKVEIVAVTMPSWIEPQSACKY